MMYLTVVRNRKGFTLIELLVVIAIIGLLASVVLASLNSAREKGRDSRRKADLKQLQLALELYYDTHGSYPGTDGWIEPTGPIQTQVVNAGYLAALPVDPTNDTAPTDRHQYAYYAFNINQSYCIYANLENPSAEDLATFTNAPHRPNAMITAGLDYAVCGG